VCARSLHLSTPVPRGLDAPKRPCRLASSCGASGPAFIHSIEASSTKLQTRCLGASKCVGASIRDWARPRGADTCRSSHASFSTALVVAVEPQQPGCLSHNDAAAAPVDHFPQRQKPHRRSSFAALAQPAAQRPGPQHRVRQARSAPRQLELRANVSGRPVCTAWASDAERRAVCLTDC
jgi:hypothetical protein